MKKRNLLAVFALSIVTLGIYDLYWLVVTKKELNQKTRTHVPTIWLLFVPVILAVVALIVILAAVASSPQVATNSFGPTSQQTASPASAGLGIAGMLMSVLAFLIILPLTFYWFFKFSKAVSEYTNGKMNTALTFLLLWLIHFIGVVFVQDAFNDMIESGTVPGQGSQPMGPPQPVAMPVPPAGYQAMQPASPQPASPAPAVIQPTQSYPTQSPASPQVVSPESPTPPPPTNGPIVVQ